jgi:hypothetical protein
MNLEGSCHILIKVLSQHLAAETEETQLVFQLRSDMNTSWVGADYHLDS